MRIRALSVFEGVVYHCWPVDRSSPCRPQLEVEAVLRPGDADAEAGPLLLSVADYIVMVGGLAEARPCLEDLAARGRIVQHLGADHIAFPTWARVDDPGVPGRPAQPSEPTEDPNGHDEHPEEASTRAATTQERPVLGLIEGGRAEGGRGEVGLDDGDDGGSAP